MSCPVYDIVIPTVGRASLAPLVDSVFREAGSDAGRIVVVDDRRRPDGPLPLPDRPLPLLRIERSGGRGPAAARNTGIRASSAPWVVFVDDDVLPERGWGAALRDDLLSASRRVGGVQGRVAVPIPENRRPTDWERNVAALATAQWITADIAYRRAALLATGGFDERFPRAYREDADLAIRVLDAGWQLAFGRREVRHPVGPAPWWISIAKQRGNVDDALMAAKHGTGWRLRAGAPRGSIRSHATTSLAAVAAAGALLAGRRRTAVVLAGAWVLFTGEFAFARCARGPRTAREITRMIVTSVAIPPYASALRATGRLKHRRAVARRADRVVDAVIVDRDGTIVTNVPYNADPDLVEPVAGARAALDRMRAAGLPVVVASNQSGVASGRITPEQLDAVNRRVEQLLGPFAGMFCCPHANSDNCDCRKPAAGLITIAAGAVGARPERCIVVGDCAADVGAAHGALARSILVPNGITRKEEIATAPLVADDLQTAADYVVAMARGAA